MSKQAHPRQGATGDLPLFAALIAIAIAAPLAIYPIFLMNVLCFALFALAFNLLIGYTGLLSFGHAMFFGFAAYVAGHLTKIGTVSLPYWLGAWSWVTIPVPPLTPELAILVGTAVAALMGLIAGAIAIRRQGIYFAMVTLALAQMVFFFCVQAKFTGGEDGIQAIPRRPVFGLLDIRDDFVLYYFVLAIFAAGFLIIHRTIHSPFGQVLKAIRENEPRAISLGYATDRFKLIAFVLSAALAGCAGATKSIVFQLASLTDVQWQMSGEVVLMTLVGGMGTVFGPIVGAAVIATMQHYLSVFGEWVLIIQGAVFVAAVLLFRRGIVGELLALCPAGADAAPEARPAASMNSRIRARHDSTAMTDHLAGEPMRGDRRVERFAWPRSRSDKIAGVEPVARRGRIDRLDHLRYRHMLAPPRRRDQRAVRPVLHHDFPDAERLQPIDRRLRTGVAPQHRLVVERRQRHVDALERLEIHRSYPPDIAGPAVRPEIAVEGDLDPLLSRKLDGCKKAPEAGARVERQRNSRKVDHARGKQAFGDARPFGKLEQLARGSRLAPIVEKTRPARIVVRETEARQSPRPSQDEVASHLFRRRQSENAIRMDVVAERGRKRRIDARASQINRRVEGVAAAGEGKAPVGATRKFEHHFADRDDARARLIHTSLLPSLFRRPDHRRRLVRAEARFCREPAFT